MSFFRNIKQAVYSPAFYKRIPDQTLGQALKYFFLLILILTVFNLIPLFYSLFITIPQEVKNFITQSSNYYPQELEVKIEKGTVSTNVTEPYLIPLPESEEATVDSLNNLLVIDTKTPYSATQFDQYKTVAWLTKDTLFVQGSESRPDIRAVQLSQIKDLKVNKDVINSLISNVLPWVNILGPILIILVFFGLFIGLTLTLIYLLILALLVLFLSKIFKWGLTYGESYKILLFASTLGLLINLLFNLTSPFTDFHGFPFMFTLITLAVITINLQNSKN